MPWVYTESKLIHNNRRIESWDVNTVRQESSLNINVQIV